MEEGKESLLLEFALGRRGTTTLFPSTKARWALVSLYCERYLFVS